MSVPSFSSGATSIFASQAQESGGKKGKKDRSCGAVLYQKMPSLIEVPAHLKKKDDGDDDGDGEDHDEGSGANSVKKDAGKGAENGWRKEVAHTQTHVHAHAHTYARHTRTIKQNDKSRLCLTCTTHTHVLVCVRAHRCLKIVPMKAGRLSAKKMP